MQVGRRRHFWGVGSEDEVARRKMETLDDLIPTVLDDTKLDQVIKIGAQLPTEIRLQLAAFLHEFKDVFTLTHADIPGIIPK